MASQNSMNVSVITTSPDPLVRRGNITASTYLVYRYCQHSSGLRVAHAAFERGVYDARVDDTIAETTF